MICKESKTRISRIIQIDDELKSIRFRSPLIREIRAIINKHGFHELFEFRTNANQFVLNYSKFVQFVKKRFKNV